MKFLTETVFLVSSLSAVNALLLMLAPDRYRREVKAVLSLIIAASVIGTFINADFSDISGFTYAPDLSGAGYSSDEAVKKELSGRIADYIGSLMDERGISCKKIEVETSIDENRSIFITKASLWLGPDQAESEPRISSLILSKIGDIDIEFIYEDD